MTGREIPPIGPDDDSDESILERLAIEDIRRSADFAADPAISLNDFFVPLTDEELAEGHPAPEIVSAWLESVQAHMAYFQVADADRITLDEVQELNQELLYNPLDLEDLVLIVKDELNEQDADSPIPTVLTFDHIVEASNRLDLRQKQIELTQKAITSLTIRVFGQEKERQFFIKAIESPTLARKIRRFGWILDRSFMQDFPQTVRREQAARKYENRIKGNTEPIRMNFPDVLDLANRTLRGKKVEVDEALLSLDPNDHVEILKNRMLSIDIRRAIAASETVKSEI